MTEAGGVPYRLSPGLMGPRAGGRGGRLASRYLWVRHLRHRVEGEAFDLLEPSRCKYPKYAAFVTYVTSPMRCARLPTSARRLAGLKALMLPYRCSPRDQRSRHDAPAALAGEEPALPKTVCQAVATSFGVGCHTASVGVERRKVRPVEWRRRLAPTRTDWPGRP